MAGKGNIKGITIEFAADSSELTKALKAADDASKKAQKSLKEIDKALKFNPGNITLLKQKQIELKKAIDATTKELEGFKKEQAAMDAAGEDKASEKYLKLQSVITDCENALKRYNKELNKTNAATTSLGQLGATFSKVGGQLTKLGNQLRGVSMAAAGVATAIGAITVSTGIWADDLNTLSKVTGIGTAELQMYAAAADLVDVEVGTIAKSVTRMKKNMLAAQKGTGTAAEAFDALGIKVEKSNGSLRSQDDIFAEVIEKLGKMTNETERDALAMSIFGKTATELNPLIEDCGETFKKVADEFAKNGLEIVDQETLDKANAFNDSIDTMKLNLNQAKYILGAKLGEAFGDDIARLSDKVGEFAGKIANMNPTLLKVISIIAGIVAVLAPLLTAIGFMTTNIGRLFRSLSMLAPVIAKLGTMCDAFFTMLLNNPVVLIIGIIATLIVSVVRAYKEGGKFKEMCDRLFASIVRLGSAIGKFVKDVITKMASAFKKVKDIGANIVSGLWNGISGKFKWLVGRIKEFATNVKDKLKAFFGIKSPSRWARDMVGANIAKDIGVGFMQSMPNVQTAMSKSVSTLQSSMSTPSLSYGNSPMQSAFASALGNANITVISEIDGKVVAQTTAPFMNKEINAITMRNNRKLGLV